MEQHKTTDNFDEIKIQIQLDKTICIMKNNIEKVLECDNKLDNMEDHTKLLIEGSRRFKKNK